MINLKSLSKPLCKFAFKFTSFSWSNSASRSSTPVFALVKRKQLLPRLLHPLQISKIYEGQVGDDGRFLIKSWKNDSALFHGSPILLSSLSSWKLNLRSISPLYGIDYKSLINDEERIRIFEVVGHAAAEQKMSTAFNKYNVQQVMMLEASSAADRQDFEQVFTDGKLRTRGKRVFVVSPYSLVTASLSAGDSYLSASRARMSQDVHSLIAMSQLYEMAYKLMDNDAARVRFSVLREDAVEDRKIYCFFEILREIFDIINEMEIEIGIGISDEMEIEIEIEIYRNRDIDDVEGTNSDTNPDGNVNTDPEDHQEADIEDVDPENGQKVDIRSVDPEDDNRGIDRDVGTATDHNNDHGGNSNGNADGDSYDDGANEQEEEDSNNDENNDHSGETRSDHRVED